MPSSVASHVVRNTQSHDEIIRSVKRTAAIAARHGRTTMKVYDKIVTANGLLSGLFTNLDTLIAQAQAGHLPENPAPITPQQIDEFLFGMNTLVESLHSFLANADLKTFSRRPLLANQVETLHAFIERLRDVMEWVEDLADPDQVSRDEAAIELGIAEIDRGEFVFAS